MKPTTLPWPQEAALFALTVLALLAALIGPPAEAQEPVVPFNWENAMASGGIQAPKKPGVGLPGAPAEFNRYWCEQKRPPGRSATCTARAPAGFDCRLCPSSGWLGNYAEFYPRTIQALETCWRLDFWGTKGQYAGSLQVAPDPVTGELSGTEFDWMQVRWARNSAEYRTCWYEEHQPGGKRENPYIINEATYQGQRERVKCMKAEGAWPAPGETASYVGYDINWPADVCANAFPPPGARPNLPVWVRNDLPASHPENQGATPPPVPVPAPAPVHTPPPATPACSPTRLANCAGLKSPFGQEVCAGCPCPAETPPRFDLNGEEKPWHCIPVLPVPEPPPIQTCLIYEARILNPTIKVPKFVPGIPSTARVEVTLAPQGEGPCS